MAKEQPVKKQRRLRAAPQTMRERAEHAAVKQPKQNRFRKVTSKVGAPFRSVGRITRKLRLLTPFRFIGHLIARFLIPPYVRNSFGELRLVTWPSRKQTLQLTSAVIIFSVVFGLLVAVFDFGLDKLFKQVILR